MNVLEWIGFVALGILVVILAGLGSGLIKFSVEKKDK